MAATPKSIAGQPRSAFCVERQRQRQFHQQCIQQMIVRAAVGREHLQHRHVLKRKYRLDLVKPQIRVEPQQTEREGTARYRAKQP
jgi:hypothetical protein